MFLDYKLVGADEGPPDETAPAQIEIGTSLVQTTTDKDVTGAQIIVSHKPAIDGLPGAEIVQAAPVTFQQPVSVIKGTRTEPNHPGQKAGLYVGKMNSTTFAGDQPRWWLCTLIRGLSDDGSQSYRVNYEFQRREATWDAVVIYVDDVTGRILTSPVVGESLRTYQVLEERDFGALSLGL